MAALADEGKSNLDMMAEVAGNLCCAGESSIIWAAPTALLRSFLERGGGGEWEGASAMDSNLSLHI